MRFFEIWGKSRNGMFILTSQLPVWNILQSHNARFYSWLRRLQNSFELILRKLVLEQGLINQLLAKYMQKYITIISLLTIGLFIMGCPMVDVKELNFTRTKPEIKDVIGVWTPDSQTLKDIRERGGYPPVKHELILRQDGSFSMINMPDWWRDGFGKSKKGFESGTGSWRLSKNKDIWDIWTIELNFPSGIASVNLYRQSSPYLIFIRVGDPNDGNAMFFERTSSFHH